MNDKIKIDFLVTGTGRCGSVYMARLLTSLGINCCHEGIFTHLGIEQARDIIEKKSPVQNSYCSTKKTDGTPIEEWVDLSNLRAESSYMAAPYLSDPLFDDSKIIHIVRNPLKVISSHVLDIRFFEFNLKHMENMNLWQDFVLVHLPLLNKIQSPVERACYYYVHWNKMIENHVGEKPYLIHRVEEKCNDELLAFLDLENPHNYFNETNANSWKNREKDLTIDDIPCGSIKKDFLEMTIKYGYKIKKSII